MKSRKFYFLTGALLCILIVQSYAAAQATTSDALTANTAPENIKNESAFIHFGDLIDVDVIGSVEYDWRGTLNPEGFLDGLDFIENPIFGLCRSEEEIAAEVAKAYSRNLRDPKVVVKILDRSNRPPALLYGAVKTPQRFQIRRPVFLNELIVISGGLTERASGKIQIYRPKNLSCQLPNTQSEMNAGNEKEDRKEDGKFVAASQNSGSVYLNIQVSDLISGKKEANPKILSGDVITVLEAESIYVIGGVASPKQISARSQITLSRAVASAGGVTKTADAKTVTIYRREAGETKIIQADLEKIKTDASADLILQSFDIVEVAETGRVKSKFTPVLKIDETSEKKTVNLPLRIID